MNAIRPQIVSNLLWANAHILIRYVTSFAVVIVLAKFYSPNEFGQYQLALTYLTIFESVSFLHANYVRNVLIQNPEKEESFVAAWLLQTLLVWLVSAIFCAWGFFFENDTQFWILMSLMCLRLLFKVTEFISIAVDARLRNDLVVRAQIIYTTAFNLSRAVVAGIGASINWIYACTFIYASVAAGTQLSLKKQLGLKFKYRFVWPEILDFIKGSFWSSVTSLLAVLQIRIAAVLLESRMDGTVYGNYQLLFKLIEPALSISLIALGANYSVLVHTLEKSPLVFPKRFLKVVGVSIAISTFASLVFVAVPKETLIYVLGEKYRTAFENLNYGPALLLSNTLLGITTTYDFLRKNYAGAVLQYFGVFALNVGLIIGYPNDFSISSVILITSLAALLPSFLRLILMAIPKRS